MDKRPNLSSHKMRRTRLWQVRLVITKKVNRLVGREWSQVLVSIVCRKHLKHGATIDSGIDRSAYVGSNPAPSIAGG